MQPSAHHHHERHPTMLEDIAPIRELCEHPEKRRRRVICLEVISGIGCDINARIQETTETDGRYTLDRVQKDIAKNYRLPRRCRADPHLLLTDSVIAYTQQAIEKEASPQEFAHAFLYAAAFRQRQVCRTKVEALFTGPRAVSGLSLPGTSMEYKAGTVGSNHRMLYENNWRNYLRLIGALPAVKYDELHSRHLYLFTDAQMPTQFAHKLAGYRNGPDNQVCLVQGKEMLEMGPGNGSDVALYKQHGAKAIYVADSSQQMLDRLAVRFPLGKESNVFIPQNAIDMSDALDYYAQEGKAFDTIAAHSCIHYFDDEALEALIKKIHACLKPGGHFAFAVKAPGAPLDGNGICLFEDATPLHAQDTDAPHGELVRGRMWLNLDGQTRIFRSEKVWQALMEKQFDVVMRDESHVENYESPGVTQKFYHFICRRRETQLPTQLP